MSFDKDGQPTNTNFNARRNVEKAVYGLRGLLYGITADEKLTDSELLFLDVWLRNQEYLKNDGDVIDLLDLIGDILKDEVVTADELEELNNLVTDILDYKTVEGAGVAAQVNELVGLITGIAADNVIEDSEIELLVTWIENNPEIKEEWPATELIARLNVILEDGVITQEEREDLLETIKMITGVRFEETGLAHGFSTEFLEDQVEGIDHIDRCFCFTGKFVSGPRKVMEKTATEKGGSVKSSVTKAVDYLVIGTLASRDWRFSSHGGKIEQALKLKDKGSSIQIITERTWLKHAR